MAIMETNDSTQALPIPGRIVDDLAILQTANEWGNTFCGGTCCKKFSGSMTVQLIREALLNHGVPCSPRDVFIIGIPIEIDLIIPIRHDVQPIHGIIYRPEDVLFALEIKTSGLFNREAAPKLRKVFERIESARPKQIKCLYVTLVETPYFRDLMTLENEYTLFWDLGRSKRDDRYERTNQWQKLIDTIKTTLPAA